MDFELLFQQCLGSWLSRHNIEFVQLECIYASCIYMIYLFIFTALICETKTTLDDSRVARSKMFLQTRANEIRSGNRARTVRSFVRRALINDAVKREATFPPKSIIRSRAWRLTA